MKILTCYFYFTSFSNVYSAIFLVIIDLSCVYKYSKSRKNTIDIRVYLVIKPHISNIL